MHETTADVTSSLDEGGQETRPLEVRWVVPGSVPPLSRPVPGEISIGRDADCDVRLESGSISRRHACIKRVGPLQLISDLQSKNGVYVNGRRVQQAALSPGDVVRLGDCLGVVSLGDSADSVAPCWVDERLFGGPELALVVARARKSAIASLPVVIQGETGTGKEQLARAIHRWSGRDGAFVVIPCATFHRDPEAAAFAAGSRDAEACTVMLDEVSELPPEAQATLLGVVERAPVSDGAGAGRQVVSTTQIPLARAVTDRHFRADLRGRLEGVTFVLSPLRERRADIVPTFLELVSRHAASPPQFSVRVLERLALYEWPGNVRELELLVRRLLLLHGDEPLLRTEHLADVLEPPEADEVARSSGLPPRSRRKEPDPTELSALQQSLEQHRGNLSRAAQEIGISRPKAYRLLRAGKPPRKK